MDSSLDAGNFAKNVPGRSVCIWVERRMAPLSHRLAGLILPCDYFGSHFG